MQYSILLGLRLANLVCDVPYLELLVKLLLVQAPNVKSINSEILGVARLNANILDISSIGRDFWICTMVSIHYWLTGQGSVNFYVQVRLLLCFEKLLKH